jgi:hypothetical protein
MGKNVTASSSETKNWVGYTGNEKYGIQVGSLTCRSHSDPSSTHDELVFRFLQEGNKEKNFLKLKCRMGDGDCWPINRGFMFDNQFFLTLRDKDMTDTDLLGTIKINPEATGFKDWNKEFSIVFTGKKGPGFGDIMKVGVLVAGVVVSCVNPAAGGAIVGVMVSSFAAGVEIAYTTAKFLDENWCYVLNYSLVKNKPAEQPSTSTSSSAGATGLRVGTPSIPSFTGLQVVKQSGTLQPFSKPKMVSSLTKAGATQVQATTIANRIHTQTANKKELSFVKSSQLSATAVKALLKVNPAASKNYVAFQTQKQTLRRKA